MDRIAMQFSVANRGALMERLERESFDLLVIGGGITGAGIALDAAARGLRTALVEKDDFAFGTSSRSTKLIHGGLRYLKQLEFGLVKEVGSERATVHRLAPHLVLPEKMLLPLYEKRGFGSLLTSFGLKLYDWLAGVKPEDQRRMLTRRQTLKAEPLLNAHDIKGGALYAEYRTDDARLTIEIIKAAFRQGALPLNYVRATELLYHEGRVAGAGVIDQRSQKKLEVRATAVVNAAGPWVDELREMNQSKEGKFLHLTKGVHLVVAREKLPVKQSIYFDVGDGRMIFAIPRGRTTYVGTTDTNYEGSKDEVFASYEDADYLLRAVNHAFSNTQLTVADVESSWAGLRPLIHEEGKSASELSRKDEIFESSSGLISIAGGKLTGYRKMAERVVDLVAEKYLPEKNARPCSTDRILLAEEPLQDAVTVRKYADSINQRLPKPDPWMADYLVHNYGRQAEEIIPAAGGAEFEADLLARELHFVMHREMAVLPLDFLVRRSGLLFFDIERMKRVVETTLAAFARLHGWTAEQIDSERKKIELAMEGALKFRTK